MRWAIAGGEVLIDKEDYERLKHYRYRVSAKGYAVRSQYRPELKRCLSVGMAHDVLGVMPDLHRPVDHKNWIKLDNRRSNLRVTTVSVNIRNQPKKTKGTGTSGVRGVYWRKDRQRYVTMVGGRSRYWKTLEAAVAALESGGQ